ncbi:MAG TPA: hypothetical protein VFF11_02130, partial [Candidatus Binatia bacterium]|nr:hypothetical protein [Candidatus Binatia bacterium]
MTQIGVIALHRNSGVFDALDPYICGTLQLRRIEFRAGQPRVDVKNRVDGVGVVDLVRTNQRRI